MKLGNSPGMNEQQTFIEQVQSQHTTTTVPLGCLEPVE